jgi:DNA-binding response OmpR family regulator
MAAKRILAVENNELVLSFLEDGLTTAGYDVDTATNGREALEKIDRRDYDVIISDVRMPELDGLGLCRALGARPSGALRRLVLLTGPESIDDHRAYLDEAGGRALAKPVGLEHLRSVVERVIVAPEGVMSAADCG